MHPHVSEIEGNWSGWIRHNGSGLPVPVGTVVEVFSAADPSTARNGVVSRIGIAGVDIKCSWFWTLESRDTQRALPIDSYRVRRPKGMIVIDKCLAGFRHKIDA